MKAHPLNVESSPGYVGGNAYNCSIVEHKGKTKLFFRYEKDHGFQTQLAMCEIGAGWSVVPGSLRLVNFMRHSGRITTLDDPRAIVLPGDRLIVVHAQGCLTGAWQWTSAVCAAEIADDGTDNARWLPKYGQNMNMSVNPTSNLVKCEKNWSPFNPGTGELALVYRINPLEVVYLDLKSGNISDVSKDAAVSMPDWKWGDLSGGTPLMPWREGYAGFFHTKTEDNPGLPDAWTYHVGFYAISASKPHRITHISRQPLFTASFNDKLDKRSKDKEWRPNVVYPCGWMERGGKVIVSAGWQDCRCCAYEMEWDEVLEHVSEVK